MNRFTGISAAVGLTVMFTLPAAAMTPADCTENHFAKTEAFTDPNLTFTPVHVRDKAPFAWSGETATGGSCAGLTLSACLDRPRSAAAGDIYLGPALMAAKVLEDGDLACVFVLDLNQPVWVRKQDLSDAGGPIDVRDWYGAWSSGRNEIYLWSKTQFAYLMSDVDKGPSNAASRHIDDDTLNGLLDNPVDMTNIGDRDLVVVGSDWYEYNSLDGLTANSGLIAGRGELRGNMAIYRQFEDQPDDCAVVMVNLKTELLTAEIGTCGGFNTTFRGKYSRDESPF